MKPVYFSYTLQFSLLIVFATLFSEVTPALAQVVPDNTLGDESSVVNSRDATSESIDGGAVRGQNLFHSFEEFNVGEDRGVYFANPDAVTNIFSRVTGDNVSNILGTLGVDGAANLFLINPNGIVFGEGASLDVQGSFAATTADGIEFGEQGFFSASDPEAPKLLTINPSAYLFNQVAPGAIANNSQAAADFNPAPSFDDSFFGLRVPNGESLLLLGGDLNFDGGGLVASSGRIDLGAIAGEGIVGLNANGSLNIPDGISRGDVSLTNGAGFLVAGDGGGDIAISAKNISLDSASTISAGIYSNLGSPDAQAGDIFINATDNITVDNSRVANKVDLEAVGNAGNLSINANSLELANSGQISAITLGQGNAGIVEIFASGNIIVDGKDRDSEALPSGITSLVGTDARGDAGGITIFTTNLDILNKGRISASTYGQGNVAEVNITAKENIFIEGVNQDDVPRADSKGNLSTRTIPPINLNNLPSGGIFSASLSDLENSAEDIASNIASQVDKNAVGNAEGINILTANLNMTNGGKIDASTFGQGNAGGIKIIASEDITVDEQDFENNASSITSQVDKNAVGNAGSVTISTTNLNLTNGGKVDASTFGQGNAGRVKITASEDINADGSDFEDIPSGITSQVDTSAVGNASGVTISTTNLNLLNGARVDASTFGQGNAGAVNINADNIHIDGEYIRDFIIFDEDKNVGGIFSAVNEGATGDANGIKITARNLILTNAGTISSSTFGQGNAGNITIEVDNDIFVVGEDLESFFSGIFSRVDKDAVGDAGNVAISTTNLKLIDGGRIDVSTLGQGNAGAVNITAIENISVDGKAANEEETSLIDSRVELNAQGDAGGVVISTTSLNITNGGRVDASTFGQGNAGELKINADLVNVDRDSLIVSRSESAFDAGKITLDIANSLQIKNSSISTRSSQSSGGNLTIAAGDIQLRGDSDITTNIFSGEGSGGNIAITSDSVIAFDDSDIFAFARDGQGGNINLNTPAFFAENFTLNSLTAENTQLLEKNNRADVNATGNQPGVVSVPDVSFIQNSLTELPNNSINTDELVANSCVSPVGDRQQGKFIITGGQSLPVRPGDGIPSKYPTGEVRNVPEHSSWRSGDPIVEPQGAYRLANGKLVLSRECN
jgi:filamentous hemagglutinin family protein